MFFMRGPVPGEPAAKLAASVAIIFVIAFGIKRLGAACGFRPFLCGHPVLEFRSFNLSQRWNIVGAEPEPKHEENAMTLSEGLMTTASSLDFPATVERLEKSIASRGMTVMARIDHAKGAEAAGLSLPPTVVLIFGNAKAGTPLMQVNRTVGVDLPLKVLVWQDEHGATQMTHNDVGWLAKRYALSAEVLPFIEKMKQALDLVLKA
jgi:uncharacterized protein (DUF302 family)